MGRAKNPNKKSTEESVREAMDKEQIAFKSSNKKNFEAPKKETKSARDAFSSFWASAKKEYKRDREMEDILWAHLTASGFDKPELFEKGLQHFGLKK